MSMKNEALYNRTVDVLVQAYFDDTLQHRNCAACAVGNLVAAALGYSFYLSPYGIRTWRCTTGDAAYTSAWYQLIFDIENIYPHVRAMGMKQISATGYSIDELAIIEHAFECALKSDCQSEDEWMFNGLMSVIDVLDQIHENTDQQLTSVTKTRFQKAQI